MKVLLLSDYYPPDKIGGVGEIVKNIHDELVAAGHDVWVLTTGSTLEKNKRIIRSSQSLNKGILINNIIAYKLIRKHKIDVINMHQSTTTLFLLLKLVPFIRKRIPKIVNSFQVSYFSEFREIKKVKVQGHTFKPKRSEYLEKWINAPIHILLDLIGYTLANEVTVVSDENRKEFYKTYGRLLKKDIKIIPNGVDPSTFKPKKAVIPKKVQQQISDKIVLCYVGVFRTRKRVFNLLFSLKEALKANSSIVLMLVGGGRGYESRINTLIIDLGLENNVINVGKVPNSKVIDYINASDVFCLLSSYEGMPIAILEAMAAAKPILTTEVSGMIDLVIEGETGYLCELDNIPQTTKNILKLTNDKKLLKRQGRNSRIRVLENYTWEKVTKQYLEVYQ